MAATINVPADHNSIQAAINASSDGDTVVVAPGTYQEHIDFSDKAITVQSSNPTDPATVAATIIDGNAAIGQVVWMRVGASHTGTISGFTITGGYANFGGGIKVEYLSTAIIMNNVITDNESVYGGGGIYGDYGSFVTIKNNLITNNTAPGVTGGGIFIASDAALIENNTICGNSAGEGGGIYIMMNATVRNSIVAFNTGGAGIHRWGGSPTIAYCDVYGNTGGDYANMDADPTGTSGNLSKNPAFADAAVGDYRLRSTTGRWNGAAWVTDALMSPCIDNGDPASACTLEPAPNASRVNMGFDGNTPYASKSAIPTVALWTPKGVGVSRSTPIVIRFSVPMTHGTVQNNFLINKVKPATGTFTWLGTKLTYTPAHPWKLGTRYWVTVGRHARSTFGVEIGADKLWGFTTVAAVPAMVTAAATPTATGAQITLNLASAANVTVSVRNLAGREIAVLQPGQLAAGVQTLLWNGKSATGTKAPAGTYLLRVNARAADGTSCSALTALRR